MAELTCLGFCFQTNRLMDKCTSIQTFVIVEQLSQLKVEIIPNLISDNIGVASGGIAAFLILAVIVGGCTAVHLKFKSIKKEENENIEIKQNKDSSSYYQKVFIHLYH